MTSREIIARLQETPLFGGLDEAQLERLSSRGIVFDLQPDESLIREGETADALFVVLDGELEVTKRAGLADVPLARVGPGSLPGVIAALEGGRRLASVRAVTRAQVLRIPTEALRELLSIGPDVALAVIRTAVVRLRGMEATLREQEKLAGLGTLAAGLAHELNNPAAAALRSLEAIVGAVGRAESLPRPSPPPHPPASPERSLGTLERADRIDELTAYTAGDLDAAGALADAGWTAAALAEQPPEVISWLAADASLHQLLGEMRMALERIREIVTAVKGYAYLDQAPVQRVDVRVGLEQTLVILRHRLKHGVTVERTYSDDLPEIEVYGSELNQVWTNLVDNAIDAMDGRGVIAIDARVDPRGSGVLVTICDDGPGIPADVRPRLFEPFFTTKPPGKGSGLGLHISHQVVARHGGELDVSSEPGRTCFTVYLPERLRA